MHAALGEAAAQELSDRGSTPLISTRLKPRSYVGFGLFYSVTTPITTPTRFCFATPIFPLSTPKIPSH